MSGFSVRVLTTHGQALVAGATAGNRLEFKRMRVSQSAMTEQQAAASVPTDFSVDFGSIKSASASGSVCRVVATYKNPLPSELHLKAFALCGQLENAATEDVVAVQSGGDVDVALAPHDTPGDTVLISFSLNVAAGSAALVEVTGSESATLADLDRFVSCHKAGDSMSGEAQEIYGAKSFRSPINALFGLDWPAFDVVGNLTSVKSQLTGLTGGATQMVHYVFRMTNETAGVTQGLKCLFDGPSEKMTLSSDVDRVELPTLALAPERSGGAVQLSRGQLLLVHVTRSGGLMSIFCGEVFTGYDGWSIWTALCKPDGSFDEGYTDLSTRKFRAMSDTQGLSNGEAAVLLVQCVE